VSWEKLGHDVRARRTELGLTQAEIADRGGPSVETLRTVENNRAGRLSPRMRRALERVLGWESGSIDAVLAGAQVATQASPQQRVGAADRFALARQVLSMRSAMERHAHGIAAPARVGLAVELERSARQAEDAIIEVLARLDEAERAVAIALLAELRNPEWVNP
jgi:transcriptional regulator with XRE-family HTH domain